MTIAEKLKQRAPNEIQLYKEGVFWVAYEQSAFAVCKIKPYKPKKKFMDCMIFIHTIKKECHGTV